MVESLFPFKFNDKSLVDQALTHPSLSRQSANYERLEFLGDHVLGMVISKELFNRFPKENEGQLTKRLAGLICGEMLAKIAAEMNLGEHIRMAQSEESGGGRLNKANLENALEAIIGAIYLDQGLEPAERFIIRHWDEVIDKMIEPPKDPKSTLQEWAQARGLPLPEYNVRSVEGPSHAPIFEVEVVVQGQESGHGNGTSKRAAEQEAASRLLAKLD